MDSSGRTSLGTNAAALDAIENLVERIGLGEVVFFVGAGFSLDSEGNFGWRLMQRLLWRLQALTVELKKAVNQTLRASGSVHESDHQLRAALQVLEWIPVSLQRTFSLSTTAPENWSNDATTFAWNEDDVGKLAEKYYESNDWFCATFEKLLEFGYVVGDAAGVDQESKGARLQDLIDAVTERESWIQIPEEKEASGSSGPVTRQPVDSVPLCPIAPCLFRWAHSSLENRRRDAGKTLFLDSMGFADAAVMGGSPEIRNVVAGRKQNGWYKDERRRIAESYRGKLYPRHQVLARLAREGLCPIALTTNYDLLLEGAWRLSGFEVEQPDSVGPRSPFDPELPATPLKRMAVVGSPVDFVERGKANRTSLVVKVHGCVDEYRARRQACLKLSVHDVFSRELSDDQQQCIDRWEWYLRQMVFTYREIQNWREDSWARDYLATLQRTRSVAFVGYSLQDPVIHDAFRTVYEEMASHRERDPQPVNGKTASEDAAQNSSAELSDRDVAPAFFLGTAGDQSFHATEVLHAATHAAGGQVSTPHDHRNYLRFRLLKGSLFPNLDDIFLWTYHRTMRERQMQMLQDDLRSIALTLLRSDRSAKAGGPLPSELDRIEARFRRVLDAERDEAARWFSSESEVAAGSDSPDAEKLQSVAAHQSFRFRRRLERTVRWTWYFHPALWKEFACLETQKRRGVSVHAIDSLRKADWYHPAIAAPGRVAWGVVVELALRWLLGQNAGVGDDRCLDPRDEFCPLDSAVPALKFYHCESPYGDVSDTSSEVTRAARADGLLLTCAQFRQHEPEMLDASVGVWHEWQLPIDGSLWETRDRRRFNPDGLIPDRRHERQQEQHYRRRSSRRIVWDLPFVMDVWRWAQGLSAEPRHSIPVRTDGATRPRGPKLPHHKAE